MDHRRAIPVKLWVLFLGALLVQAIVPVNSYNILMVFTSHSKSHLIIASSLLKGLAEEGHNVTMISSFPQKEKIPNYRDIFIEVPLSMKNRFEDAVSSDESSYSLKTIKDMFVDIMDYSNNSLWLPEVRQLMKDATFDLVITSVIGGRMQSGLAAHFNCPLAYLYPVRTPLLPAYQVGNPFQLSTVPAMLSSMRNPMTFKDRVKSVLCSVAEMVFFSIWDNMEWYYYNKNFPSPKYPPYHVASRNVSILLSAHHFSQGVSANVPQIIEIGGIQMDAKLQPLPENLQQFLDNAPEGVIFFSFGTNAKLKKQNQEKIWAIFRALGRTQMKVLLKYDTDEVIPGLPKNILSAAWLPQREILAHPNVKLFVSHGGLGSIMESKYYGVPVLGIPIFADQPGNVNMAVKEGWAVRLDFSALTESKMNDALNMVLKNSSYTSTVETLSSVYRDRPLSAMKTAIYWVEYVIRHKGALHMRSSAQELNFLQRNSIDVLAFYCFIIALLVVIVKLLFRGVVKVVKEGRVMLLSFVKGDSQMKESKQKMKNKVQ